MSCVIFNSAALADARPLTAATKRQKHVQLFIRSEWQKSRELEARKHPAHALDPNLDRFWVWDGKLVKPQIITQRVPYWIQRDDESG